MEINIRDNWRILQDNGTWKVQLLEGDWQNMVEADTLEQAVVLASGEMVSYEMYLNPTLGIHQSLEMMQKVHQEILSCFQPLVVPPPAPSQYDDIHTMHCCPYECKYGSDEVCSVR